MWNKYLILIVFVVSMLGGCKSKKRVVHQPERETSSLRVGNVEINNLDFHYFSGRASAKVEFDQENRDVTLNFRIQKDKSIWISVTALLGIEAARILITPDSVMIINKLKGEYIKKPFDYIYRYTNTGVTFAVLQDLLIANVSKPLLRTEQLTLASSNEGTQLVGVKDQLSFQYSLNEKLRPKVFRLTSVGRSNETLEAFYGGFTKVGQYDFPHKQNIKIGSGSTIINVVLGYSKVDFNVVLDFPFSIPASYKAIE